MVVSVLLRSHYRITDGHDNVVFQISLWCDYDCCLLNFYIGLFSSSNDYVNKYTVVKYVLHSQSKCHELSSHQNLDTIICKQNYFKEHHKKMVI